MLRTKSFRLYAILAVLGFAAVPAAMAMDKVVERFDKSFSMAGRPVIDVENRATAKPKSLRTKSGCGSNKTVTRSMWRASIRDIYFP